MNRWDMLGDDYSGNYMTQFDDGDYVRYEDAKKMENALREIIDLIQNKWHTTQLEDLVKAAERGLS